MSFLVFLAGWLRVLASESLELFMASGCFIDPASCLAAIGRSSTAHTHTPLACNDAKNGGFGMWNFRKNHES